MHLNISSPQFTRSLFIFSSPTDTTVIAEKKDNIKRWNEGQCGDGEGNREERKLFSRFNWDWSGMVKGNERARPRFKWVVEVGGRGIGGVETWDLS